MHHLHNLAYIAIGAILGMLLLTNLSSGPIQTRNSVTPPSAHAALPVTQEAESANECDNTRTVQVNGAATIKVTPDRVLIKLGVQSNDTTPDRVQTANTATIQAITSAVQQLGVASKEISTDYYIVHPVYENYDSLTIKGYRIDNVVAITLNDVTKTSDAIIAALKAGANQVVDVQFFTSQLRRYRDQARTLAMRAATEKAQALAEASNTRTGCVLQIAEQNWTYYSGGWWGGRDSGLQSQNVVQTVSGEGQPPLDEAPISLGQLAIRAEINASFSLR